MSGKDDVLKTKTMTERKFLFSYPELRFERKRKIRGYLTMTCTGHQTGHKEENKEEARLVSEH